MPIQRITSRIIQDGAIVATDVADSSITTAKIADGNVTGEKLGATAINANNIVDGVITNAKLAGSITGDKIAVNQITSNLISSVSNTAISGVVTAAQLAGTLDLTGKTVTLPSGVGGKVLQVVQSTYTGTPASTSTSYTDTGLEISVTPVSSTSKFLIEVDCYFGTSGAYHDTTVSVDIYDNNNGVQITPNGVSGTSAWDRWINLGEGFPNDAGADAQYHVRNGNGRVLYTPSTRYSPFVFKLRARANSFGGWIMNRNYTQNDTRGIQTVSTLTVMEIAA